MHVIKKISMLRHNTNLSLNNRNVCPLARQIRLSFEASNSRNDKYFNLIHLDVCGAYKAATYNNMKFFLTFVDDYSRWIWVFLLRL